MALSPRQVSDEALRKEADRIERAIDEKLHSGDYTVSGNVFVLRLSCGPESVQQMLSERYLKAGWKEICFTIDNVKLVRPSSTCIYDRAYQGVCGNPVIEGTEFCSGHLGAQCVVCHEQATHECAFAGQFVCGAPLCAKHNHKH